MVHDNRRQVPRISGRVTRVENCTASWTHGFQLTSRVTKRTPRNPGVHAEKGSHHCVAERGSGRRTECEQTYSAVYGPDHSRTQDEVDAAKHASQCA